METLFKIFSLSQIDLEEKELRLTNEEVQTPSHSSSISNRHLIEPLEELHLKAKVQRDQWRVCAFWIIEFLSHFFQAKAYQGAITRLKNTNREIKSMDDLKGITGIGPSISKKIEEILKTGKFFGSITWYLLSNFSKAILLLHKK